MTRIRRRSSCTTRAAERTSSLACLRCSIGADRHLDAVRRRRWPRSSLDPSSWAGIGNELNAKSSAWRTFRTVAQRSGRLIRVSLKRCSRGSLYLENRSTPPSPPSGGNASSKRTARQVHGVSIRSTPYLCRGHMMSAKTLAAYVIGYWTSSERDRELTILIELSR